MLWGEQLIIHATSMTTSSNDDIKEDEERFQAIIFLTHSEFNRFSTLTKYLLHKDTQGKDKYSTTVAKAYKLLQEYEASGLVKTQNRYNNRNPGGNNDSSTSDNTPRVSFTQVESRRYETVPGADGSLLKNLLFRCFKCQKKGCMWNNFPNCRSQQETQSFMTDASCLTLHDSDPMKHLIPQSWILLDTCTSKRVSSNMKMVTDISDCNHGEEINLHANGGVVTFKQKANLNCFLLKVYLKKELMATIISFLEVCDIYGVRLIFYSDLGVHFDVIFQNGKTYRFKRINAKLLYFNTDVDKPFIQNNASNKKSKDKITGYSHLQTLSGNKSSYTRKDINKADEYRSIQEVIIFPSDAKFKKRHSEQLHD